MSKQLRFKVGIAMLMVAFLMLSSAGGVAWGATGFMIIAGVMLIVYGIGFIGSSSD